MTYQCLTLTYRDGLANLWGGLTLPIGAIPLTDGLEAKPYVLGG